MTRIVIDPNVRVRGQLTYAGFEDVEGAINVGQNVDVVEPESGLVGKGLIVEIDLQTQLVYLGVDWASLVIRDPADVAAEPPELLLQIPLTIRFPQRDTKILKLDPFRPVVNTRWSAADVPVLAATA